ncbi:Uncharacterized conserved protein, contains HEPN domain [Methanolobus profundi]|uniref:Uncharacterized conserved protein, contains HEPN domain n=2 Tax=Methanolobus profundi TaxID=487685 RepID=A0A1I4R6K1_9EURY|nr:Uncharacterized conserved protein, contains HEPN domain [Methanolobus profundi]
MRDIKDYVQDIYNAMESAEDFVSNYSFDDFIEDTKTQYAVIRALEIIGEAAKNVPDDIRQQYPTVPWKDLAGIRDKLIHAYFGVNLEVVWLSVKEGIPEAKPVIEDLLRELNS